MTARASQVERPPLRAPRENGAMLVAPPWDQVDGLVHSNVALGAGRRYDCQGRCLAELAREARRQLLCEARRWTTAYRDVGSLPPDPTGLVFLAGHQPQLFHPGVWIKNFALDRLARRFNATAVNLLIDSDTLKATTLRVPGGTVSEPQVAEIPFDRFGAQVPHELRRIVDDRMFSEFGRRVAEHIAPLVPDPLIRDYWPLVRQRMQQTDNLAACLAQSRHRLEGDWGAETLEVPQSRVCESEPFYWFVAHLLARLPEFRTVYNEAVGEYRRAHRIRSTAHPVPDLATDGPWHEAPLWVFTPEDPRRRRLFARRNGRRIVISDRHTLETELPLSADGNAGPAVERLMELAGHGVKIRSRALLTTLWARLALGDLFLHGIGGAKYDQLTDLLIERFFGLKPPALMVFSGTLHLPIQRPPVAIERLREIRQELRRLEFHPERYVNACCTNPSGASDDPAELIAAKALWIQTPQTPLNARTRCRAIRQVNRDLQPWVTARRDKLRSREIETVRALRAEKVLAWREYVFCLYPEKTFREFLGKLLPKIA